MLTPPLAARRRAALAALVATLLLLPGAALACRFDMALVNAGSHAIDVRLADVSIRSRPVGSWRRADRGGWRPSTQATIRLNPGQSVRSVYNAVQACNQRREVRLDYICRSGGRSGSSYRIQDEMPRREGGGGLWVLGPSPSGPARLGRWIPGRQTYEFDVRIGQSC